MLIRTAKKVAGRNVMVMIWRKCIEEFSFEAITVSDLTSSVISFMA
jgi:hypothetical protein